MMARCIGNLSVAVCCACAWHLAWTHPAHIDTAIVFGLSVGNVIWETQRPKV